MTLLNRLKESEGFKGRCYLDSLGKDTIGYGTLLPLTEKEAELLLQHRLAEKIQQITKAKPEILKLSKERQDVIYEMCYQLGVGGVLKFKRMWEAIENNDFEKASLEMLDSRWANQTSFRAYKLAQIMKG